MAQNDMAKAGYSSEEDYFYKRNLELIEQRRKELDALKKEADQEGGRSQHWMKCPKCGGDMEEIGLANILVDKCRNCEGIFFDHGELETLFKSKEVEGFFQGMKRIFK